MPDPNRRTVYLSQFDEWRATKRGENPWTPEALDNVATLRHHYRTAIGAVRGTLTSGYRSERVNKLVGGEKLSRHLRGLACDIRPGAGLSVHDAAEILWGMAHNGVLGLVQQLIEEPTWVHVGWYGLHDADNGMTWLRKRQGVIGYDTLEKWREI